MKSNTEYNNLGFNVVFTENANNDNEDIVLLHVSDSYQEHSHSQWQ
jgi:hypothetical protein